MKITQMGNTRGHVSCVFWQEMEESFVACTHHVKNLTGGELCVEGGREGVLPRRSCDNQMLREVWAGNAMSGRWWST